MSVAQTDGKSITLTALGKEFRFHAPLVHAQTACYDWHIIAVYGDGYAYLFDTIKDGRPPDKPMGVIDLKRRSINQFAIDRAGKRIATASARYQSIDIWERDDRYNVWIRRAEHAESCHDPLHMEWIEANTLAFRDVCKRAHVLKRRKLPFCSPYWVKKRVR